MLSRLLLKFVFVAAAWPVWAAFNCQHDVDDKFDTVVKIIRQVPGHDPLSCTGTLVRGGCYILTAGHCVMQNKDMRDREISLPTHFKIRSGPTSELKLSAVSKVFVDPDFVPFGAIPDIAILKLAQCTGKGSDLDFSPANSIDAVLIGGYGFTQLHDRWWIPQIKRHMGTNKIERIEGNIIYVQGATVLQGGKAVLNSSNCITTGQDSGSALFQNGKIRGVFFSSLESQNSDYSVNVIELRYLNLAAPLVRAFIESVLPTCESELQTKSAQ